MFVRQLMTRDVECCTPTDSLDMAAKVLWDHDVGCVPVCDEGKVVGMVTDRDLCMASYTQGCAMRESMVASCMSSTVFSCGPQTRLEEALRLMGEHQVRRLVVMNDEGQLLGVLSMNDVVREAARTHGKPFAMEVVKTMASICAPRPKAVLVQPTADVFAREVDLVAATS
jgi:CBS domain-containing protein